MTAPFDPTVKTITTKVAPAAWARAKEIAQRLNARVSDVFSACLLHMPEDEIARIIEEQRLATGSLPKAIRGVLANAHRMSDDEKRLVIEALQNA